MNKVPFGELDDGDIFKHNTFRFKKGGRDAGRIAFKWKHLDKEEGEVIVNATCLDSGGWSAYFADDVKVLPIKIKEI